MAEMKELAAELHAKAVAMRDELGGWVHRLEALLGDAVHDVEKEAPAVVKAAETAAQNVATDVSADAASSNKASGAASS